MIKTIRSFIFFIFIITLVSCGGSNCQTNNTPPSNLYQIGILPNNSTLFANSESYVTPSDGSTSGVLTLSGGNPNINYELSFSTNPNGPTVSCTKTPCIVTSGTINNTIQINFNGNNQPNGIYEITVYYTPLTSSINKTSTRTALPHTIKLTINEHTGYQLGVLPNNSTLFASANAFITPSDSYTSGVLTLNGGTPDVPYVLSFSSNPTGPTVTCTNDPCVITSGTTHNTIQVNFNGNNQPNGIYNITVYYTPLTSNTTKTSIETALPNTIELTIDQHSGYAGNLSIMPLTTQIMEAGESQVAIVSLSDSNNITNPVITTITPQNNKITVTPNTCSLTTNQNSCNVTITAIESGSSYFSISASGYTSTNSEIIEILPAPQFMIISGQTSELNKYSPVINNYSNLLNPNLVLKGIAQKDSTIVTIGYYGATFVSHNNGQTWNIIPATTVNSLSAIIATSTNFIAVGDEGTIITSTDGDKWSIVTTNIENGLKAISRNNNTIVTVGNDGTILVSNDSGDTWTNKSLNNVNSHLSSITNSGSNFIAVGENGAILVSKDNGDTWTNQGNEVANLLSIATIGNNTFTAVGQNGKVLVSTDGGTTWTSKIIPNVGSASLVSVVGNGTTFMAGGSISSNGAVIISNDSGNTWVKESTYSFNPVSKISYSNNSWLAVGNNGSIVKSSNNGTSWTNITNPEFSTVTFMDSLFNNDIIINIGQDSSIVTSTNGGTSWENKTQNQYASNISAITNNKNTFVMVGRKNTISNDYGSTWGPISISTQMYSITHNESTFIAVGYRGAYMKSNDNGVTWESGSTSTGQNLRSITNNKEHFVAVGQNSALTISSDNGVTWIAKSAPESIATTFLTVRNNESTFIAVGGSIRKIIISNDNGATWHSHEFSESVNYVNYSNNTWLATCKKGLIAKSTDNGNTWTEINTGFNDDLTLSANSKNVWILPINTADGLVGNILISHDNGDTWAKSDLPTTNNIQTIQANGKYFMLGGQKGTVLSSRDYGITWESLPLYSGGVMSSIYSY